MSLLPDVDIATLRARPDLQVVEIKRGLNSVYVIKDPVRLKYFELDEHEHALLDELNRRTGLQDLLRWFSRRFSPLRLSPASLRQMIWRLDQQGLLISSAAGQGPRHADREQKSNQRETLQWLGSPWAIRLPGIHPGPWLAALNDFVGWIFHGSFVVPALAGLVFLAALAIAHHRELVGMVPQYEEFISQGNLGLLATVLIAVKVLHELGHAVAACRQGCECKEIGVLLLAGMPTLYCDVSDAWILSGRWQRIAVSFAGIWCELLISAAAFIIWVASAPGVVHSIAFNVMVVCSIGTVLFNANPLVRYDGYYILMDLTGISNLGQRSREAGFRLVNRWIFGEKEGRSIGVDEVPAWCLLYGFLAAGYQLVLTALVIWGLHWALKPYSAAELLWAGVFFGLSVYGAKMIRSSFHQARRLRQTGVPRWRISLGYLSLALILIAVSQVPLPSYLFGEAIMLPTDRQPIVTTVAGASVQHCPAGANIQRNIQVVQLENRDMMLEYEQLNGRLTAQNQHLQALLGRRNHDASAADQIPVAEASVAALERQISYLQNQQRRLTLISGVKGRVYSAPFRLTPPEPGALPGWKGSLLDPANRDAWIAAGEEIACVGDTDAFEAVTILSQDDMDSVAIGQSAEILLIASSKIIRGEVLGISRVQLDSRGDTEAPVILKTTSRPQDDGRTGEKWYQVRIRCLDSCPKDVRIRSRGKVRIQICSKTVGTWALQQFFRTFRWLA